MSKRKATTIIYRSRKQVLTNEDWHPTKDGKVDVSLYCWSDGQWKVSVWGGDDFGLEFLTRDEGVARRHFDRVVNLTTKDDLRARGFKDG